MQHAGRWTGAGQGMDYTACRQMDRGRTGDGSYSMPADGQGQGRRWIIQHAGRWTEAGQEMDHTACRHMDTGRAGDGSYSMPADGQGQGRRWMHTACRQMDRGREIVQAVGVQIDN
jgi:hypothetical protein